MCGIFHALIFYPAEHAFSDALLHDSVIMYFIRYSIHINEMVQTYWIVRNVSISWPSIDIGWTVSDVGNSYEFKVLPVHYEQQQASWSQCWSLGLDN